MLIRGDGHLSLMKETMCFSGLLQPRVSEVDSKIYRTLSDYTQGRNGGV